MTLQAHAAHQEVEETDADIVRATLLNILKWALCGLYKSSGSGEMRLMG